MQQLLDLYGQWFRSRIDLLLPTHELITPIFSGLYIRRFWAKLWQKQKVLGGFNKYLKKITMKLLRHDKLYELPVSKRFVGLLSRPGLSETDILDLCSYCLLQLWTVLCVWLPVGTGLGLFLFNIFPSTLCNPSLLFYGPTFTYHFLVLNLVSSLPCFPIFLLCCFTIHISFQSLKLRSQALYNVLLKSL